MKKTWLCSVAATLLLLANNLACAAIMTSIETDIAPPVLSGSAGLPYTPTFVAGGPSTTDLLHLAAPSGCGRGTANRCFHLTEFKEEAATGLAALTDGSVTTFYGRGSPDDNHSAYATGGSFPDPTAGGKTVTYSLTEPTDIGSIVVFGGWNDGGRDHQHYDLQVSIDSGATFSTLGSIDVNPGLFVWPPIPENDTTPVSTRVAFTDDASYVLAAGVTDIRLNFLRVENGYSGYTEIDVFAAVPEPSSIALGCCFALIGFVSRRPTN